MLVYCATLVCAIVKYNIHEGRGFFYAAIFLGPIVCSRSNFWMDECMNEWNWIMVCFTDNLGVYVN